MRELVKHADFGQGEWTAQSRFVQNSDFARVETIEAANRSHGGFGLLLHKSVFGRCVYAIGTNEEGRPSDDWRYYAFVGYRDSSYSTADIVVVDLVAKQVLATWSNAGVPD